jgi:hypothetical protein
MYCRPYRVTLYYEGEIEIDEVKLFEIPVPNELSKAKGRKTISVTVAYDPPVSVTHRDRPAGVQLTWGFARGDVSEDEVKAAIAEEAEREMGSDGGSAPEPDTKKTKKAFRTGTVPKRPQQRGSVQKNIFTWVRGDYGETYRLAVTAKATRPAHQKEHQRFALVVTLEGEDQGVNIYTAVRARLSAGRVRVRVGGD